MMNKKNKNFPRYTGIYAVIALLIIIGTVGRFLYGILSEADKGTITAKTTFSYFAKYLISASEKEEFAEKAYREKAEKLAEALELKGFVISDSEERILLSWSKDKETVSRNESEKILMKSDSFFVKNFTAEINVKTKQNPTKAVTINAAVPTLNGETIYILARNCFFVIFAVLLLTLIIILTQSLFFSGERIYADIPIHTDGNLKNEKFEKTENTAPFASSTENNLQIAPLYGADGFDENADKIQKQEYTLEDLNDLAITKKFPYEEHSGEVVDTVETIEPAEPEELREDFTNNSDEHAENAIPAYSNNVDGQTILNLNLEDNLIEEKISITEYSQITGLPIQKELNKVLEAELKNAAAAEKESAFSIIKLKDFTIESLIAQKIAEMLIGLIKLRDMIFEFEDDGFAVILQDTDLDQGMKKCEEIYNGIKNILDSYNISEPVMIGLTTRSGRLVSAERMIEEASAAVTRAISGNNDPIVAFRVNTEKYRKFIAETA